MISERQNDGIDAAARAVVPPGECRSIPTAAARRRAARFTGANGWSTRASGGRRSRTQMLERRAAPSASTIGATSARASTASPASTIGPAAAHMVGRGETTTTGWTMPRPPSTVETDCTPSTGRSRSSKTSARGLAHAIGRRRGVPGARDERRHAEARWPRRWIVSREVAMPNALDTFRAQREAADQVYARLTEVTDAARLGSQRQVDAVATNRRAARAAPAGAELAGTAQRTIDGGRAMSANRRMQRFWPGVWRRWVLALGVRAGGSCGGRRRLRMGDAARCGGTRTVAVPSRTWRHHRSTDDDDEPR